MVLKTPNGDSYDPWERAFMTDGGIDAGPLLRGINDYETALRAHRKAHEYDAREKHKRFIAEKLQQYSD